jgi:hypothetical protein
MSVLRYNDPRLSTTAGQIEQKYRLPVGILDAIRMRGERSNSNQVSEAGARGVYQFIPQTRQAFISKYGIDPWKSPEAATEAAALHLRDDYQHFGSWNDAVSAYHGGRNKRNWGRRTRAYGQRVGDYDTPELDPLAPLPEAEMQYYSPANAPEAPSEPVPLPGPAASTSLPQTAPVAQRKRRGGKLGALESVFMPEPDSLMASALRNGIWDAKAGQVAYRQQQQSNALAQQTAQVKFNQMVKNGEFKVVGNNIAHFPADGSPPKIIAPPSTPGEKERLYQLWQNTPPGPAKDMLDRMLAGANAEPVLTQKGMTAERVASTRAGATTTSARIRAAVPRAGAKPSVPVPQGWTVVK